MATTYTILPQGDGTYRVRATEHGTLPLEYYGPFKSEAEANRFIAEDQKRHPIPTYRDPS